MHILLMSLLYAFDTLHSGARDEEPLVNARVNRSGGLVAASGDVEGAGLSAVCRVGNSGVGTVNNGQLIAVEEDGIRGTVALQRDFALLGLASDELLPSLGALTDNVHGVLLVLALAAESELVLGLSIGDFVDAEPLVGCTEKTWQVSLDVFNVVELGGQGVVDIDDDDLPVGLTLVKEGHDTEDLDLLDLTGLGDELTNLTDIERVVVTVGLGLWVGNVGVLPGLASLSAACHGYSCCLLHVGHTWGKAP